MRKDLGMFIGNKEPSLQDVTSERMSGIHDDCETGELQKYGNSGMAFGSSVTTSDSSFSSFFDQHAESAGVEDLGELIASVVRQKNLKSFREELSSIEQQLAIADEKETLAIDASLQSAFMRAESISSREETRRVQKRVHATNKSTSSTPVRPQQDIRFHQEELIRFEAQVASKRSENEIVVPAIERANVPVRRAGDWLLTDKTKEEILPTAEPILQDDDESLAYAEEWEDPTMKGTKEQRHRVCFYVVLFMSALVIGAVAGIVYVTRTNVTHPREDIGIQGIISQLQLNHDEAWQKALHWMIYDDETTSPFDANFLQRFLLAGVYHSFTWNNTACAEATNVWCTLGQNKSVVDARPWLTAFSECEWAGLECDVQGNIVSLDLPDHTVMTETLPVAFLQHLPFLRTIRIGASQLQTLPDVQTPIGRHWRTIALDGNEIRGSIPESWYSALPNLGVLQLARNYISGSLPDRLANWRNLKRLDIQGNRFTGSIPDVFDALKSVAWVWLNGNRFAGRIPPTLLQIGGVYVNHTVSPISNIDLGQNRLTGSIPEVAVRRWNTMRFDRNLLSGTLPDSLLRQSETLELDVSLNRLQGTISPLFSKWNRAVLLDLSYNAFSGDIPTEIALLPELSTLNLQRNFFNGSVPEELCRREGLPMIRNLRADCLAEANGFVETPCTCCSVCCNDEGGICEDTPTILEDDD